MARLDPSGLASRPVPDDREEVPFFASLLRGRIGSAIALVSLWTVAFASLMVWERSRLGLPSPTSVGMRRETLLEAVFESLLWLAGTAAIVASYGWFRRLDLANQRALAALRQSEHDIGAIIASIDDFVFRIDAHGRLELLEHVVRLPPAFAQLKGFAGCPFAEVLPASLSQPLRQALTALADTGRSQEFEFTTDTGGPLTYWNARVSRRLAGNEAGCAAIVALRDVTLRGAAENALRDSEERCRLIYERSMDGIVISDLNGAYLAANGAACAILGMTEAELIGLGRSVIAESSQGALQTYVAERTKAGIARGELQLRRKDGSLVDAEGSTSIIELSDGRPRAVTIFHDVTARKRAEATTREHALRWETAVEAIGDGLWDWDGRTDTVFLSTGWKTLRGYTDHEVGKSPEEWSSRVHPDDWPRVQEALKAHQRGETTLFSCEYRMRRKDGTYQWILDRSRIILRDEHGRPLRMVGMHRDITSAREAAEALAKLERRFFNLVSHLEGIVWEADGQTRRFSFVSPQTETLLGYPASSWLEEPGFWEERIHPEDRAAVLAERRDKTDKGEAHALEYRMVARDGREVWLRDAVAVEKAGESITLRGVMVDITERKHAEQELRRTSEWLLRTQRVGRVGGWSLDLKTNSLWVSPEARKIYGVPDQEATLPLIRSIALPADRPRLQAALDDLVTHGTPYDVHFQIVRATDGAIIDIHSQAEYDAVDHCVLGVIHDVTRSRHAEFALRESEERYRQLVELSPEAILVVVGGKTVFANRAAALLLGATKVEEVIGLDLLDRVHPGSRALVIEHIRKMSATAGNPTLEQKWLKLDDTVVEVAVVASRLEFGGKPAHLVIAADISNRRAAEANLRKLSRAVEQSPVSVVITDAQGTIEYVNPSFTRNTGYSRDEAIGQNPRILKSGMHSQDFYRQMWETIAAGREWRGEFHNRKKNGDLFWEATTISPITDEDGVISHYLAVREDITERRRAEERIRKQAALLDVTQDAILVLDLQRSITYMNRVAERLYGVPVGEAIGLTYDSVAYGRPAAEMKGDWEKFLATGASTVELLQTPPRAGEVMVQERAILVRDDQGRPREALLVVTDITEAKRMELKYLRAQRLESLGSLASGISHDLNNVLTPILVGMEMLRPLAREARDVEMVQMVQDSARRGAEIVHQLLLFGRGSETPRAVVNVGAVLNDLARLMQGTFPKNISLRVQSPKDLWSVEADKTQLHQVLLNLCVNARDAMPNGGQLAVTAENVHVDDAFAHNHIGGKAGPHVVLRVIDTGMGIPAANVEKIFEPFFTTKPVGKGSGLGLATVLGITRSHGGFVTIESEEGRGASFSVYMPAKLSSPAWAASEAQAQLVRGKGELVLLVDDEQTVRRALEGALTRSNYRVITATNGAEALALYAQHAAEVRVVVTDIMMPIMDGVQLIHALHRLNQTLPVLAMSGLRDTRPELEQAFGRHLRFLVKPFVADTALGQVRELIDLPAEPDSPS